MNIGPNELVGAGLILALIPAAIAHNKGRSFFGWYLFGLFLFFPALIVAILISERGTSVRGVAATSVVLTAVEAAPGSTQKQLALRTGISINDVLGALTELRSENMVRYDDTGQESSQGKHAYPVVAVYPTL